MEIEKKVAILGGSFDPPTIAHVQVVAEVYNECQFIDEVWIVPCGDARSDKKLKANGKDRIAMLKLILEDIIDERVPVFVKIVNLDQ